MSYEMALLLFVLFAFPALRQAGAYKPFEECVSPEESNCYMGDRWRFDAERGICTKQPVCELMGTNKFTSHRTCTETCVPDRCVTPGFELLCLSGSRWRFNTETGKCEYESVCKSYGPNKWESKQQCLENCKPTKEPKPMPSQGVCSAPALHPNMHCLFQKAWRYSEDKRQCEHVPVCPLTGPNKFKRKEDCQEMCQEPCAAPAYLPGHTCFILEYGWRFNGDDCVQEPVCPGRGPNKFATRNDCLERCLGSVTLALTTDEAPTTPAEPNSFPTEPFYRCQLSPSSAARNAGMCPRKLRWYFDQKDRKCHKFLYFGCFEKGNSNNFHSKHDCEDACLPNF